tara:strand:+ start:40452 stop:42080 length:1629 start_codon:yes stop_codon:yes gene_type:complete
MARISEDIRYYLPSDPYYYKVDNLPLQDLLRNDKRLQTQIDELQQADVGVTVNRQGILELKPFIDNAIPGTISVNPGSFIGRVQRSSDGDGVPASVLNSVNGGTQEIGDPPTSQTYSALADWDYNTGNPPTTPGGTERAQNPAYSVGRTAVINFPGGNISIDGFSNNDFQSVLESGNTDAPRGRIDVVGITTINGALDDPFIPGNAEELNVAIGNGQARLATLKGAGLITTSPTRQVGISIGERFQTIGQPGDMRNDVAKNPDGTLTNDPPVGTYPLPDDIINICFSRNDIRDSLTDWAQRNRNASFFLPIAYVFVDDQYTPNNPIPQSWLYDIRPFFRTAELTLNERQALAASVNPSITNPVVTSTTLETRLFEEVDRTDGVATLQEQINTLKTQLIEAFANLNGSLIQMVNPVGISMGTTYANYFPTLNAGVPAEATHVILQGEAFGEGGDGFTQPQIIAIGEKGITTIARAYGGPDDGPESYDVNQVILPLIAGTTAAAGGYFQIKAINGLSSSSTTLKLQGYITRISNTITLPAPEAP